MRNSLYLLALILLFSCKKEAPKQLQTATYRAILKVNDVIEMPFMFEVKSPAELVVINAEERILVDEVSYKNDSIFIKTPVFEGFIAAKLEGDGSLNGSFIKENLDRVVSFHAEIGTDRFPVTQDAEYNVSGNWETVFSPDVEADRYIAKGVFKQKGQTVTGTFETTTGDYRFLEGVVDGNELKLSTFDGAHAFLFIGTVTDSTMQGRFYSGNHWQEPFVAKRNEAYMLPNTDSLTYLKAGYDKVSFSYPDVNGNLISLNDERFQHKVVLVQIMGTWCPNCLDESKYFAEFYKKNRYKDVEIVALAFEYVKTEDQGFKNIQRLKDRIGITYPVLLAQTGTDSKIEAQQKLPMLNQVLSYPTTIFIDKTGQVRKIHTGFNGPATGKKFFDFKVDFEGFVSELIAE
jgi:thiol-disulfide isomerase/thioredoxin